MTITVATFRADFPAFNDGTVYGAPTISFWLGVATKMLRPDIWPDDLIDFGTELFVAHHLALASKDASGGVPGMTTGLITSKSVGPISKAYDVGAVTLEGAGHWNLTTYGVQFYQLMMMAGAQGLQL